jgi:hypothetical protein
MIRKYLPVLFVLLFAQCTERHTEVQTIQIKGKPVVFVRTFHLERGSVKWSYKGEIKGKVGVCISGCSIVAEKDYITDCPQTQILSGKFDVLSPYVGQEEGVNRGTQRCFVFVPEKGSSGTIRITFEETIGGW